jgi:hypothetical protein
LHSGKSVSGLFSTDDLLAYLLRDMERGFRYRLALKEALAFSTHLNNRVLGSPETSSYIHTLRTAKEGIHFTKDLLKTQMSISYFPALLPSPIEVFPVKGGRVPQFELKRGKGRSAFLNFSRGDAIR